MYNENRENSYRFSGRMSPSPLCYDFLMDSSSAVRSGSTLPLSTTARILDGNSISTQIREELALELKELAAQGVCPVLAAVLVGDNPASVIYVRNKVKACQSLGIYSEKFTPPATATTGELLRLVQELNAREEIDGILVQLPLPPDVDTRRVLEAIDPAKDVDGFHPINVGKLVTQRQGLVPCTPAGIMEILRRSGVMLKGARAVVIGRSDLVGKPVALLLMHEHATVTICHSRTRDLPGVARQGEILVAAMGKPAMITGEFVRPGATVIDVGINKLTDQAQVEQMFPGNAKRLADLDKRGYTLVGDVHPDSVLPVAGALTPVPGGVGPLTIAMLMASTVRAACLRRGLTIGAGVTA